LPLILDTWVQAAELTPSDGAFEDNFGYSLSVDGKTIVVGAPGLGGAYVFVEPAGGWSTTTETAKLTASDGVVGDDFGDSVAVSGNTIVVSVPNSNSGQGAVYIFVEPTTGWTTMTETAKLTASDSAPDDYFGWSVAVSGNVVAAGAPYATVGSNSGQGAAYVFVKPAGGWATTSRFKAKLTASDGAAIDYLATSVSLAGGTLVAGAAGPAEAGFESKPGAAYVFVKSASGWSTGTQTAKLTASDGLEDRLGASVAIAGTTIVAGAPNEMVGSNYAEGAAYMFVIPTTGWANMTETAKLTPPRGKANESFGSSVGISGNSIVVGAPFFSPTYKSGAQGAVYVFARPSTGWTSTSSGVKLAEPPAFSEWGWSVGISGGTVAYGPSDCCAGDGNSGGAAYVLQKRP
jgi:hypothetical protein